MARIAYSPASRKTVDADAGSAAPPRRSASPIGVCGRCHAVRRNHRWRLDEREYMALNRGRDVAAPETCPACRKIESGLSSGVVTLRGGFLRAHRDEILNIARNEEKRAMATSPMSRIARILERDGTVEVATTDEKLARRIGREIRKACGGTLSTKRSGDVKRLQVAWERE